MVRAACKNKFLRLIDANVNRCREGLRVLEDTARFIFDDGAMYRSLRALRHKVDVITRERYCELISKRDSKHDSGRVLEEGKRENIESIVRANFRRVEESLRVLEEYSRLLSPEQGPQLKSIRYKVYQLEKICCRAHSPNAPV